MIYTKIDLPDSGESGVIEGTRPGGSIIGQRHTQNTRECKTKTEMNPHTKLFIKQKIYISYIPVDGNILSNVLITGKSIQNVLDYKI